MNASPKTTARTQSCPTPHTLGNGAWGKTHINEDNQKDKSGAKSLKLLAYKVLQRGEEWGKNGANAKKQVGQDPTKKGALPHLAPTCLESKNIAPIVSVSDEQAAAVDHTDTSQPLFIDGNGNALRCTRCRYSRTRYIPEAERERPYVWHGLCLLDPDSMLDIMGMDSRCVLVASDDCVSVIQ